MPLLIIAAASLGLSMVGSLADAASVARPVAVGKAPPDDPRRPAAVAPHVARPPSSDLPVPATWAFGPAATRRRTNAGVFTAGVDDLATYIVVQPGKPATATPLVPISDGSAVRSRSVGTGDYSIDIRIAPSAAPAPRPSTKTPRHNPS